MEYEAALKARDTRGKAFRRLKSALRTRGAGSNSEEVQQACADYLRACGFHIQKGADPEARLAMIREYLSGMTAKEVAANHGVSANLVRLVAVKYCERANPQAFMEDSSIKGLRLNKHRFGF